MNDYLRPTYLQSIWETLFMACLLYTSDAADE